MPAFIVNINANKLISVKAEWLKNPVLGKETLVFFSPNESENAFFSTDISYFFHQNRQRHTKVMCKKDSVSFLNLFMFCVRFFCLFLFKYTSKCIVFNIFVSNLKYF